MSVITRIHKSVQMHVHECYLITADTGREPHNSDANDCSGPVKYMHACVKMVKFNFEVSKLTTLIGALQRIFFSKNSSFLWKWVDGFRSHSELFFWTNHPPRLDISLKKRPRP